MSEHVRSGPRDMGENPEMQKKVSEMRKIVFGEG